MKKASEGMRITLAAALLISLFATVKSYGGTRTCSATCTKSVNYTCYTGWWYLNPTIKKTGVAEVTMSGSTTITDSIFDRCNPFVGTPPACTAAELAALQKETCDKALESAKALATKDCSSNGWSIVFQ
jgi:hypothetical protein